MKTKDLLKIVNKGKDGRRLHPFDYYERTDFLRYCHKYKVVAKKKFLNNGVNWVLLYEHYRRRKKETPKKFRIVISPKTFLELLRYYYPAANKRKTFFLIKTRAKIGFIKVKDAKEAIKREIRISQK